jgi:hypothetical protein
MSRATLPVVGLAAVVVATSLAASTAQAHLIPASQGTVNVVGDAIYAVLSVPVSSLQGVDDDHDGVVDLAEFERHEGALRAEIDRRLVISDGETPATTVRVDLILSPQHDAARDRADQIVALKHAHLGAPPRDLRVRCDLFGARPAEQEFKITATRHPASGTETEIALLTPAAPGHAFFQPTPPASAAIMPRRDPRVALSLGAVAMAAVGLAWAGRQRTRRVLARPS